MKKPASKIIEQNIENQIQLGVYNAAEALPSENELAEKYDVSRATVQKALSSLIAEKLIYSVPGKGYFVREVNFNKYRFDYKGLQGFDIKLLSVNVITPPPEVIYYLRVHPKNKVIEIKRLGYKDDKPVLYDVKYAPYIDELKSFVTQDNLLTLGDIIYSMASPYDIKRKLTFETEKTSGEACRQLGIADDTLLIKIEQIILNEEDEGCCWGKRYVIPQYFHMVLER